MSKVSVATQAIREALNINEALHDIEKYMDDQMIQYMNDNLTDPKRRAQYLKAIKHYDQLAKNAASPVDALYYEYRMYLSHEGALNLAREFYQKEIRSNTYSSTVEGMMDEEGQTLDQISMVDPSKEVIMDKGMFADFSSKDNDPSKILVRQDLFSKVLNNPKLVQNDRIVLIVNLLFGYGPGLRNVGHERDGIYLEELMNDVPKEYKMVKDQIKELQKFGIPDNEINAEKVLYGAWKADDTESGLKLPGILKGGRNERTKATERIQRAVKDLFGSEEMKVIKSVMLVDKWTPVSEAMKLISKATNYQPVNEAASNLMTILDRVMRGKSVTSGEMIKLIVQGVAQNLERRTELSKSALFKKPFKELCKFYLQLAKSNDEADQVSVQVMLMAPAFDKMVKAKLKSK